MMATLIAVAGVVLSVCVVTVVLWHNSQPQRSVTQILSDLESGQRH